MLALHNMLTTCLWCVLAWHQAPPLLVIKLQGQHWEEGLGSWVGSSWASAGMLALVFDFNNYYLYNIKIIIKVNKNNTDRAIDCSLEVLGLAITLKKQQRQAIKNCGWKRRVRYHAHWLWEILLLYAPSSSVLFWVATKHIQSRSIGSADDGTDLHKTDASCAR